VLGAPAPAAGGGRGHPFRETAWSLELVQLLADPVWRGSGVPAGEGRPVLLIPGFLAGDQSLRTMARWLTRRGYRVAVSGIRWNVGCADRYLTSLQVRLRELYDETGQPVSIVGHSRGGLLGNALAGLQPDLVAQVVTLGSPLGDNFDIAPLTGVAVAGARRLELALHPESRERRCFTNACECSYTQGTRAQEARAVPLTCVITQDDGIVSPEACVVAGARLFHVRGTHIGLAWNREVYRILGDVLARGSR
jgi:triacylglycerol lipase